MSLHYCCRFGGIKHPVPGQRAKYLGCAWEYPVYRVSGVRCPSPSPLAPDLPPNKGTAIAADRKGSMKQQKKQAPSDRRRGKGIENPLSPKEVVCDSSGRGKPEPSAERLDGWRCTPVMNPAIGALWLKKIRKLLVRLWVKGVGIDSSLLSSKYSVGFN